MNVINYLNDSLNQKEDYPYFRNKMLNKHIPQLNQISEILDNIRLREIHNILPYFDQYKNWNLVYKMSKECQMTTLNDTFRAMDAYICDAKYDIFRAEKRLEELENERAVSARKNALYSGLL